MKTAKEFFTEDNGLKIAYSVKNKDGEFTPVVSTERAIEFAKMHVEAALEEAAYNVELRQVKWTDDYEVDKRSILNAYPLDNIK
jgi:hypothetical protein